MDVQETQVVEDFIIPLSPNGNTAVVPQITEKEGETDQPFVDFAVYSQDRPLVFDGRIIWRKAEETVEFEDHGWDQEVEITTTESCNEGETEEVKLEIKNSPEHYETPSESCDARQDLPIEEIRPEETVAAEEIVSTQDADGEVRRSPRITCHSCKMKFSSAVQLKEHCAGGTLSVTNSTARYTCCMCGFTSERLAELRSHVTASHGQTPLPRGGALTTSSAATGPPGNNLTCSHCGYLAFNASQIRIHLRGCQSGGKYACPECEHTTSTRTRLRNHIAIHHSVRLTSQPLPPPPPPPPSSSSEDLVKCDLCDFRTFGLDALKSHTNSTHTELKPLKCPACLYRTAKTSLLQLHIKRKHNSERMSLVCPHCSFNSLSASKLENHINMQHSSGAEYKCVYCDYRTAKPEMLKVHLENKHLAEEPPTSSPSKISHKKMYDNCQFCGLRGSSSAAIKRHIRSFHIKNAYFDCTSCKFSATLASDLEDHIREYHPTNDKQHRCQQCSFSSETALELTNHLVESHLRPWRGVCPFCGLRETDPECLAEHIRTQHAKQKSYRCPHCDFSTSSQESMHEHSKNSHHNNAFLNAFTPQSYSNFVTIRRF